VKDDIEVHLVDADDNIVYNLIIQSVSDNQILATLSGGHVGNFTVKVVRDSVGYSSGTFNFSYEIRINSISPTQGSEFGGTLLTIDGVNFSEVESDNNVFLANDDDTYNV